MSTIENYAVGDALQFMVSTNGKTICGKNHGLGWRTRQVGGYLSDASLQQLSRDMSNISLQTPSRKLSRGITLPDPDTGVESDAVLKFKGSYHGPKFTPMSTP